MLGSTGVTLRPQPAPHVVLTHSMVCEAEAETGQPHLLCLHLSQKPREGTPVSQRPWSNVRRALSL